jgi:hypothetical protein
MEKQGMGNGVKRDKATQKGAPAALESDAWKTTEMEQV